MQWDCRVPVTSFSQFPYLVLGFVYHISPFYSARTGPILSTCLIFVHLHLTGGPAGLFWDAGFANFLDRISGK